MTVLRRLGRDRITDYEVYLLGAQSIDDLPAKPEPLTSRFVCLLALDARRLSVDSISELATDLLNAGCIYFCCWGQDCERVHDIIDEVIVGDGVTPISWAGVMTTWHDKDSLSDAVEFFLWSAAPDKIHAKHCSSALALRVGSEYEVVALELEVIRHLNAPPSNPPLQRGAFQRPLS